MEFTAKGTIDSIGSINSREGSEWHSIDLVLAVDKEKKNGDTFRQYLKIEFSNKVGDEYDKVQQISDRKYSKEGDLVEIEVNAGGSKWTNKEGKEIIFNKFKGWKIMGVQEDEVVSDEPTATSEGEYSTELEDEIPF